MTNKIPFKWERIGGEANGGSGSWRVKVIGGWLVNNLTCIDTCSEGGWRTATESMCFVPDVSHEWVID